MKKLFIVIALILVIALPLAAAKPVRANGFGVGAYLGYPSGLTVRYGMDNFRIFGNVANYYGANIYLDVGALYDIFSFEIGGVPFYFNAGAQVGFGYDFDLSLLKLSANGVVGLSYYFDKHPFELFLNVAPGAQFLGGVKFDIKSIVGGIWYIR